MRFFNTAGKCLVEDHYMLDPIKRLSIDNIVGFIEQKSYFVLHAPRQSGKTTVLYYLAQKLNREGKYTALTFSCETATSGGTNLENDELRIINAIIEQAEFILPPAEQPPTYIQLKQLVELHVCGARLKKFIMLWAAKNPKPLVLLFDEIDAVQGESLSSVLHQLRDGYNNRPNAFPQSIILCGLKDVRDYKIASGGSDRLMSSSPFNIKVESITLTNFTEAEINDLYSQYTQATTQQFSDKAISKAYELTGGQPWLVNALAREVVEKIKLPLSQTIEPEHFEDAAQRLILARATHLDSLVAKLYEPRVKRIISPLLTGDITDADSAYNDDILYLRDLGILAAKQPVRIANPIYKEIIVRVLAQPYAENIPLEDRPSYVNPNGTLSMEYLLQDFAAWWRLHGEFMMKTKTYSESAAQLVFMAFMHRVVNGGGIIDREYGVGRGRIDLHLRWFIAGTKQVQHEAVELKVWHDGKKDPLAEGLVQLEKYLQGLSLTSGTLVIFDKRINAEGFEERTKFESATTPKNAWPITVLRA